MEGKVYNLWQMVPVCERVILGTPGGLFAITWQSLRRLAGERKHSRSLAGRDELQQLAEGKQTDEVLAGIRGLELQYSGPLMEKEKKMWGEAVEELDPVFCVFGAVQGWVKDS